MIVILILGLTGCGSTPYIMRINKVDEGKAFSPSITEIEKWAATENHLLIYNPLYKRFYLFEDLKLLYDPIPINEDNVGCILYRKNPGAIYFFPKNSNVLSVYSVLGRKILSRKIDLLKSAISITISPFGYLYILDEDGSIVRTDYEGITLSKFRSYSKGGHFKLILANPELLIVLCNDGKMLFYDSIGHYLRTDNLGKFTSVIDMCFDYYYNAFVLDKTGVWKLEGKEFLPLIKGEFKSIDHAGKDGLWLHKGNSMIYHKIEYEKIKLKRQAGVDIF